jgi:hypothetical protein
LSVQGWERPVSLSGGRSNCANASAILRAKLLQRYPALSFSLICCNDHREFRVSRGTLQVNKTSGKYFNINASYTFTRWTRHIRDVHRRSEDVFRRGLERAASNQDARHRFVSNFT